MLINSNNNNNKIGFVECCGVWNRGDSIPRLKLNDVIARRPIIMVKLPFESVDCAIAWRLKL